MSERVRIGVLGAGAIAQVHHLPNLAAQSDRFEIAALCDVSARLVADIGARFHVPRTTTDYRELVEWDLDAVLLCHTDPKTEAVRAALDAGRHVFVEKPVAFTVADVQQLAAAAERAGVVAQAGYMKVYDPAFELAVPEVAQMRDVRLVMATHIHTDNAVHYGQFEMQRYDDIPAELGARREQQMVAARAAAVGELTPTLVRTFHMLHGSMIHDLYSLRHLVGAPEQVVSASAWGDGSSFSTTLAYPNGARCIGTYTHVPNVWDFRETLEVYADDRRALLSFPTGFARGILSTLVIEGVDGAGTSYRKQPQVAWETAFHRELRHFHACITAGEACRTPLSEAVDDMALIADIVTSARDGKPVRHRPVSR